MVLFLGLDSGAALQSGAQFKVHRHLGERHTLTAESQKADYYLPERLRSHPPGYKATFLEFAKVGRAQP
jgi:predicted transcriptional regulator